MCPVDLQVWISTFLRKLYLQAASLVITVFINKQFKWFLSPRFSFAFICHYLPEPRALQIVCCFELFHSKWKGSLPMYPTVLSKFLRWFICFNYEYIKILVLLNIVRNSNKIILSKSRKKLTNYMQSIVIIHVIVVIISMLTQVS